MVTLITQSQSEFALHLRAVLNLPLNYKFFSAGASGAYKAKSESDAPVIEVPECAFTPKSFVRIFGKPDSHKGRRLAVALAIDEDVELAKDKVKNIISKLEVGIIKGFNYWRRPRFKGYFGPFITFWLNYFKVEDLFLKGNYQLEAFGFPT